jgi:hypothetical protein
MIEVDITFPKAAPVDAARRVRWIGMGSIVSETRATVPRVSLEELEKE